jgi:protein TonB
MFEDSLLESGNRYRGKGRKVSLLVAYGLVVGIIGVGIIVPMVFPESMSLKPEWVTALMAPPPPPPAPPPPAAPVQQVIKKIESELVNGQLRTPTRIPQKIQIIKEEEPPPSTGGFGVVGGVPGGVPGGGLGGVIGGIVASQPVVAQPKVATPQRVRVSSGVSEGLLINRVQPTYPPLAKQARIQGTVILEAVISKEGNIENLHLIQGHPMLAPAAMDAVKRWKYKPYFLNGEPVEVDTVITVNFTLAGAS